jgi:hypothetical protein
MAITANLHLALKQLCRSLTVGVSLRIWADALCINQHDKVERSQQVAIMRHIYANASKVHVWLGDMPRNLADPLSKAQVIESRYNSTPRRLLLRNHPFSNPQLIHDVVEANERLKAPHRLITTEEMHNNTTFFDDSIQAMFRLDWFRRVWTKQEIYYAREVDVLCGDERIDWNLIMQVNHCLERLAMEARPDAKIAAPFLSRMLKLENLDGDPSEPVCHRILHQANGTDILDTAISGLDLDATDPRDKIFSLLSFASDEGDELVQPDYDLTVSELFATFTKRWIITRRDLRILSAVHCSAGRTWQYLCEPRDDEPSRATWSLWFDGKGGRGYATLALHHSTGCKYNAAGGKLLDVDLITSYQDLYALPLKGYLVGEIQAITPFPYFWDVFAEGGEQSTDDTAADSEM